MVRIKFTDSGHGYVRVHIMDTDTFQSYGMDEESWNEIKKEMNIDESSENIIEAIQVFWDKKYKESGDMYIPNTKRGCL